MTANFFRSTFGRLTIAGLVAIGLILAIDSFAAGPPTSYTGELVKGHADYFQKLESKEFAYLRLANGQRIKLDAKEPSAIAAIPTGSEVKVTGEESDGTVVVDPEKGGEVDVRKPIEEPPADRPLKTAIILYNYANDQRTPYTPEQVRQTFFGGSENVNAYYKSISGNKVGYTGKDRPDGDVFGYYTIDKPNECSDENAFGGWQEAADRAADAAGVDRAAYDRVVLVSPAVDCRGLGGLGQIGGPESWLNGDYILDWRVTGHEQGHNFGFFHADGLKCADAAGKPVMIAPPEQCQSKEYNDPFDIMGYGAARPGVPDRAALGRILTTKWLQPGQIVDLTKSGTYTIFSLSGTATGPVTLRAKVFADDAGSLVEYFYVDYRSGFPYDTDKQLPQLYQGPLVRVGYELHDPSTPLVPTGTILVDTAPETETFADAPLLPGREFEYAPLGLKIKTLSVTENDATVEVTLTPPATPGTPPGPELPRKVPGAPINLPAPSTVATAPPRTFATNVPSPGTLVAARAASPSPRAATPESPPPSQTGLAKVLGDIGTVNLVVTLLALAGLVGLVIGLRQWLARRE